MTDPRETDLRWFGRPLRNLTDREIQQALTDRRDALDQAPTKMAQDLCQIAVDRLQAEWDGRMVRK